MKSLEPTALRPVPGLACALSGFENAYPRPRGVHMSRPTLVRQEDAHGCGVACLAMVTGLRYLTVRSWFRVRAWQNARADGRQLDEAASDEIEAHDFTRVGLTHFEIEHFLADHHHAVARKFATNQFREPRNPWPPEPFAEAHICSMTMVSGFHYVVWLPDGRVFDPAFGETTLDDPRYLALAYVLGVVHLPPQVQPSAANG